MLELSSLRKNKVNLQDYNYVQDIENRMAMSDFCMRDIEVLEEILYSSLKVPRKKLARNLGISEEELSVSLSNLTKVKLFEEVDELIVVDKEKRKYFEFEIGRFDSSFNPDMEFLQGLLRKVPIHVLPSWYSIPRTSNCIFESIVEKYLLTPHIYQRYLNEMNLGNPTIDAIINDVLTSQDFKVSSSDLIAKYNLLRKDFEEILLLLEFNFVCTMVFERQDDHWVEYVTPFHEWGEYLRFMRSTETPIIQANCSEASDFAYIEKMSELLREAPLKIEQKDPMIQKIEQVRLGKVVHDQLVCLEPGALWLEQTLENRALILYRAPIGREVQERLIREAEKSIKRVLHGGWVYFDDFVQGVTASLREDFAVTLKREGKHWKYQLPTYTSEEIAILKATIFEWLYEVGMVKIGKHQGKDCFAVTSFGEYFFSD